MTARAKSKLRAGNNRLDQLEARRIGALQTHTLLRRVNVSYLGYHGSDTARDCDAHNQVGQAQARRCRMSCLVFLP